MLARTVRLPRQDLSEEVREVSVAPDAPLDRYVLRGAQAVEGSLDLCVRLQEVVDDLSTVLTAEDQKNLRHIIVRSILPEALKAIVHQVARNKKKIRASASASIRELATPLKVDLPDNLDDYTAAPT